MVNAGLLIPSKKKEEKKVLFSFLYMAFGNKASPYYNKRSLSPE